MDTKSASRKTLPTPDPKAAGRPKGAQDIRRIEARGGVTVVTKDQNASGDLGVYDLQSKTITLTGNVVVSQGQNVIHGERVVVDTVTGNARVESSEGGGPSRPCACADPAKQRSEWRRGKHDDHRPRTAELTNALLTIAGGNRLKSPD